jgi:hypothetical protein
MSRHLRSTTTTHLLRFSFAAALVAVAGCSGDNTVDDGSRTGTLTVSIMDPPASGSDVRYALRTDGQEVPLVFDSEPQLFTGVKIRVLGTQQADGRFHVQSFDVVEPIEDMVTRRGALTRSGGHTTSRVAAVLVHSGTPDAVTPAMVNQMVFTATDSAKQLLLESSFGKIEIVGSVFGWYRIAAVPDCNQALIVQRADAAALAAGVDLSTYDQVLYYFPYGSQNCPFSAVADLGSPQIPSRNSWYNGIADNSVFAHEMGHNWGNWHANSYFCGSASMGTSAVCDSQEYGDPYDFMGATRTQSNAYHKAGQGWFSGCNLVTAPSGGTFLLSPIEAASTKTLALRVPADPSLCPTEPPDSFSPCYYYVEYRQPIGVFDGAENYIGSPMHDGVLVHLGSDVNLAGGTEHLLHVSLLDMTPGTQTGFVDARLQAGRTFTDPTGLTISLLGANDGRAKVRVVKPGSSGAAVCIGGATTSNGSTCSDGVKNGNETAVDCGGECNPCPGGKACSKFDDCQSGNCLAGVCSSAAFSCTDHIKNGAETDVDCGGSCNPCTNTKVCLNNAECLTHRCEGARCVGASVGARARVNSSWSGNFCGEITIYNANPTTTYSSWQVQAQFTDSQFTSTWNATFTSQGGGRYLITPAPNSAQFTPGTTISVGFCATTGPNWAAPSIISASGV